MRERVAIQEQLDGNVWQHGGARIMQTAHTHDVLELNLVLRGRATYQMNNRCYHLTPRSLVWLFPRHEHRLMNCSGDFQMWIAVFRPSLVRASARQPRYRMLREKNPAGWFCKLISRQDTDRQNRKLEEIRSQEENPDLHRALLAQLMLQSWDAFSCSENQPDHTELHPAVEKAAARLRHQLIPTGTHFRSGIGRGRIPVRSQTAPVSNLNGSPDADASDLNSLAKSASLSPARLSRLFHQQMGIPITAYRNRLRIEQVLEIYGIGQRTTMLLAALEAGFGSYAQFYRVFSQVMGMTPRAYCRTLRAD